MPDVSIICESEVLTLDPEISTTGYTYLWSTGATTSAINVFEPGIYWVEMNAENGTCLNIRDTIELKQGVLPVVELGPDQEVCVGQEIILLNASTPFPDADYQWQDGSTDAEYRAQKTGVYEVTVSNRCGSVVDFVRLDFIDCSNFWAPSAFTPNGDGKNETFLPVSDQELVDFTMRIYDRWGNLVFIANNPNHAWDGNINGDPADVDEYLRKISYYTPYDTEFTRHEKLGSVLLLR
jgi:gliding motility-associated-like protein